MLPGQLFYGIFALAISNRVIILLESSIPKSLTAHINLNHTISSMIGLLNLVIIPNYSIKPLFGLLFRHQKSFLVPKGVLKQRT